jgi:hypothetical protein
LRFTWIENIGHASFVLASFVKIHRILNVRDENLAGLMSGCYRHFGTMALGFMLASFDQGSCEMRVNARMKILGLEAAALTSMIAADAAAQNATLT